MVRILKDLEKSWFRKSAVLYSVEKCSDNLVVPTLHQAFKNDCDQEKYLVLRGNSEIFEFIPGGYAEEASRRVAASIFEIFIFILVLPPPPPPPKKIHFCLVGVFEIIEKKPLGGGGDPTV